MAILPRPEKVRPASTLPPSTPSHWGAPSPEPVQMGLWEQDCSLIQEC